MKIIVLLYRNFHLNSSPQTLLKLYKALVLPHLTYFSSVPQSLPPLLNSWKKNSTLCLENVFESEVSAIFFSSINSQYSLSFFTQEAVKINSHLQQPCPPASESYPPGPFHLSSLLAIIIIAI